MFTVLVAYLRSSMRILKVCVNTCCCCFTMVNHKRLQTYRRHHGTVCMTGIFGCRWHRYQQSKEDSSKCDLAWFTVLALATVYMLFMLNYWIITQNSEDLLNWYMFKTFGKWQPVLNILLALTAVCLAYVLIVLLVGLCHTCLGHQLYLHWLHRGTLLLVLAGCVAVTVLVTDLWRAGWSLQLVSLQVTGPFLHIGLLVVMTLLTWLIAGQWMTISHKGWKVLLLGLYLAVMLTLLIFPPFLDSPCVVEESQIPSKPQLLAHRGGAAIAPENTHIAFQTASTRFGVYTLESDVAISYDGVPFLLHDDTFHRTTDVDRVFPHRVHDEACMFNFSDIKRLNAGSWFIERDPFSTVSGLSEEQKRVYKNQTVMTLLQYLELARDQDAKVLFDIKMLDKMIDKQEACVQNPYKDTYMEQIMKTISQSKIPHHNVLWLYWKEYPANFTKIAPGKAGRVEPSYLRRNGISSVNADFSHLTTTQIRELHWYNISVNMFVIDAPWLFSLYWCAGVHSMTTNQVQLMSELTAPVWHLTPREFQIMWITTDVLATLACFVMWIVQRIRHSGKSFHSEAISLQGARIRKSRDGRNRTMKQKLLYTAESMQDIDTAGIGGADENARPSHWSHTPDGASDLPATHSQFSTLSQGGSSDNNSVKVQLHRMSGASGISGISAISGLGVGDSSFSAGLSDEERSPAANVDAKLDDIKLEIVGC